MAGSWQWEIRDVGSTHLLVCVNCLLKNVQAGGEILSFYFILFIAVWSSLRHALLKIPLGLMFFFPPKPFELMLEKMVDVG